MTNERSARQPVQLDQPRTATLNLCTNTQVQQAFPQFSVFSCYTGQGDTKAATQENYRKLGELLHRVFPKQTKDLISFDYDRNPTGIYLLCPKSREPQVSRLLRELRETHDWLKSSCSPVQVPDFVMLNLLLNGLGSLSRTAVCGQYLSPAKLPGWITKNQVHVLKLYFTKDNILKSELVTYTRLKPGQELPKKKNKRWEFARLDLKHKVILPDPDHQKNDEDHPLYTKFQFPGQKFEEKFISRNVNDATEWNDVIRPLLKQFEQTYHYPLTFQTVKLTHWISPERNLYQRQGQKLDNFRHFLLEHPLTLSIQDKIQDGYGTGEELRAEVQSFLEDWNIPVIDDSPNTLILIHDQAYYEQHPLIPDPHQEDLGTQHLTWEQWTTAKGTPKNPNAGKESMLKMCIAQLLIQQDLRNRKLTLYDWSVLRYASDCYMAYSYLYPSQNKKKKQERGLLFLTIHPNGDLEIGTPEDYEDPESLESLRVAMKDHNKAVLGIQIPEGINLVEDTELFYLPFQMEKLPPTSQNSPNLSRRKEDVLNYIPELIDENVFYLDGNWYYSVGMLGSGLPMNLNSKRVLPRKIIPIDHSPVFLTSHMDWMMVPFISLNRKNTVYPFFAAYLRIYKDKVYHQEKSTR